MHLPHIFYSLVSFSMETFFFQNLWETVFIVLNLLSIDAMFLIFNQFVELYQLVHQMQICVTHNQKTLLSTTLYLFFFSYIAYSYFLQL